MEHRSQGGNMNHCSTGKKRSEWVSHLLVTKPRHGLLSELSRRHQVPRQTLYRWKERGTKALEAALESKQKPRKGTIQIKEYVLTLLIEAHASYRNIQKCVMRMCGVHISLGSIGAAETAQSAPARCLARVVFCLSSSRALYSGSASTAGSFADHPTTGRACSPGQESPWTGTRD